jgi:hypothetical protein
MVEQQLQDLNKSVNSVALDIRELMTEVRALKSLQLTVINQETRLTQVEQAMIYSNKRLDKVDKIFWFLITSTVASLLTAIFSLVFKK